VIERIQQLIAEFGSITGTGYTPPRAYLTECQAREWLNAGFTLDDLRLLVRYRRKVTEEPFLSNMLKWSFLIGRLDRFGEDLAEDKAHFKNAHKKKTEREKVLEVTGRSDHCSQAGKAEVGRTAEQVMSEAGLKAFEEFRKFRQQMEQSS